MERKAFDEIRERLIEVNKIVLELDPTIRAGAFELLKDYAKSGIWTPGNEGDRHTQESLPGKDVDLKILVEKHGDAKPSDNANLLAADWYRQYGAAPFTLERIEQAAAAAGLTLPERPSANFRTAVYGGKNLYQSLGRGSYKPTVAGELYLKKTYEVAKGTDTPPSGVEL